MVYLCKNVCKLYHSVVKHGGEIGSEFQGQLYQKGVKRCRVCEIFFRFAVDLTTCPCCGAKFRTHPRNSQGRHDESIITRY